MVTFHSIKLYFLQLYNFRLKQLFSVKAESETIKEGINLGTDVEEGNEDEVKKKKHRREKIGFRDRKVSF